MNQVKPYYKKKNWIILSFSMIICLVSCEDFFETTIDIDPPEVASKMVVNSFIQPDQDYISFWINKNNSLAERGVERGIVDAFLTIDNLTTGSSSVITYKDSIPIEHQPFNYFEELNTDFLNSSDKYQISISDNEGVFPDINADFEFPSKVELNNFSFEYEGGIDQEGDESSTINLTFSDPLGEDNFYEIGVLVDYNPDDMFNRPTYASSIDLATSKGYQDDFLLLSDESFDGEEKTLEIKIWRFAEEDRTFHVIWRNITEDYFRYSKTLKVHEDNSDNPFSSIAPVYSNVPDGLGIISFYQEDIIRVN